MAFPLHLPPFESDPRFEAFASRDPLFAVLTDPAYLSSRLTPESRERFFASGRAVVEAIFTTVSLHLDTQFSPTRVLEFGCGVGRLALPLAARAARRGGVVTAVDRSAAMLRQARAYAMASGLDNVSFELPSAVLGPGPAAFDLVTCYLVLQRLPPSEGLALVRALVARLLPGGIAVFQFPVATRVSAATSIVRWIREALPAANALVLRARGERTDTPFIPSHIYSLTDVVAEFREAGAASTFVVFDDHGDLSSVLAYVVAPDRPGAPVSPDVPDDRMAPAVPSLIDVRDVIRQTSIETLNHAAEQYFATLTTWDHHLAKPFASADEAPAILADLALVLRALALRRGLSVLDFGAGSGWLSRALTQLGCDVIALDVSPTALDMARALYDRVPVVGRMPAPRFLLFDGRVIDLPDASVDRIVCFHAFHHAPNPDEIVAEFGRVLAPGGRVVFAEPGPTHSRSAKSQFEMRSYGVVENDVDVHHLWDVARRHGFDDIRMFATNGEPSELSLAEYDDLKRGGAAAHAWTRDTRRYLRNVSNFALIKAGAGQLDSSSAVGLACTIHLPVTTIESTPDRPATLAVRVTNTGTALWLPGSAGAGGVSLGARVFDQRGELLMAHVSGVPLAEPGHSIEPGTAVECLLELPRLAPGEYRCDVDCVAADVTWFAQAGSAPAVVRVVVR